MEICESTKHVLRLPVIHGFKHIFELLVVHKFDIVRLTGGSVFEYHDQQIVLELSALGDTDWKLTSCCLTHCRLLHGQGVSVDSVRVGVGKLVAHNVPEELLNAVSTTLFGVRGLNVPVYIFSPTRDSRAYI